jgi:hypothetical protein
MEIRPSLELVTAKTRVVAMEETSRSLEEGMDKIPHKALVPVAMEDLTSLEGMAARTPPKTTVAGMAARTRPKAAPVGMAARTRTRTALAGMARV